MNFIPIEPTDLTAAASLWRYYEKTYMPGVENLIKNLIGQKAKGDNMYQKKQTVHNELEARALIKEAYQRGDQDEYDNNKWFTHAGEFLFTSEIRFTEFELHQKSGSTTVEVL